MNDRLGDWAFTIAEVMIVLAVSSLLLISAIILIGGQQQRTQFNQSINDIRSRIDTVINSVTAGDYASPVGYTCAPAFVGGVTRPTFTPSIPGPTTPTQGQNTGCILIGRALQFNVNGTNRNGFDIYNIAGLQYALGTTVPEDLAEAQPTAIAKVSATDPTPDNQEVDQLGYGLQVGKMYYDNGAGPINSWGVAFITNFAQTGSTGGLASGSLTTRMYAVNDGAQSNNATLTNGLSSQGMATILDQPGNYSVNPISNLTICFYGGIKQVGTITIGGSSGQLTTNLKVTAGSSC